ncbi:UPF0172-domain-containing protein [Lactarius vividus]|nr:UPF0172-domain-containing protein [Lactarius vividus]
MSSPSFQLADLAYTKLILHALKYPHQTVNGVLLGTPSQSAGKTVDIVDAVPLQHHWSNLSPAMEIGLGMVAAHARTRTLQIVGYYQAPERLGDTTLSPAGERVACKIKEFFETPIALVLDDENGGAFVVRPPNDIRPFTPPTFFFLDHFQSYVPLSSTSTAFLPVEHKLRFTKAIPRRSLHLARHTNLLSQFVDFDDYLEDTNVRFLTNGAVEAALNSPQ